MLSKSMTKKQIKKLTLSIPLKRLGTVQDQALVVLFLLSSLSSYITGTSVNVDGGQI
jgi:3-oxoacyl-[acyl-carrier protein] reductase